MLLCEATRAECARNVFTFFESKNIRGEYIVYSGRSKRIYGREDSKFAKTVKRERSWNSSGTNSLWELLELRERATQVLMKYSQERAWAHIPDLSFDDYTFHTTSAACLRIYLNGISQPGSESSSLVTPPGREIANSLMVRRTNRFSRSLDAELFTVTRVSFCLQNGMSFPAISLFLSYTYAYTFAPFHPSLAASSACVVTWFHPFHPCRARASKRMNLFARTIAAGESFTRISAAASVGYYTRFAAFRFSPLRSAACWCLTCPGQR